MTRNGMAIVEVTDTDRRAVFIDEDTLEAARLNAMIKRNRERNAAERKRVEREHRRLEKQRKRWKEYTVDTFFSIGVRGVIMGGAIGAMVVEMMHPIISIVVSAYCLSTACIQFGVWYGSKH